MSFILLVSLFIIVIFKNLFISKKDNQFLIYIIKIYIFILFVGNYQNADYLVYKDAYSVINITHTQGFEPLFELLMKIFNILGFSYEGFIFFVGLIIIFFMNKILKEFSYKEEIVLLLYSIYPLLMNIIQVRNFLSSIIVIYAIKFVISKEYKKYILFIILAGLIQSWAYLALTLLFLDKIRLKWILRTVILIIPIMFIVYCSNFIPYILAKYDLIPQTKIDVYFYSGNKMKYGYLAYIFLLNIFPTVLSYFSIKVINKNLFSKKHQLYHLLVIKLNCFMLILTPFYLYSNSFERIPRNFILLNYILFGNILFSMKNKINSLIYTVIIITHTILCMLIFTVFYIAPIFQYNFIL